MFLKKSSPILKISIFLSFIIIVSVVHFILFNNLEHKDKTIYNTIKLLERNDILLKEIVFFSEKFTINEDIKNIEPLLNSISQYDYSISILINGGIVSEFETKTNIPKPKNTSLQKLIELERLWVDFKNEINKLIATKEDYSSQSFDIIQNSSLLLQSQNESIIKFRLNNQKRLSKYVNILHIIAIIIYVFVILSIFLFIKNTFFKSIDNLGIIIDDLTIGKTKIDFNFESNKEFSHVYSKLTKLNYKIEEISDFVNHLVSDNYEIKFKDYNKKDALVLSLVKLRDKLKENIELNKKRQNEEKLRQWFADGQAKFNDILRESSSGMKSLAEASLINLVKFFDAAQGGFFILNEDITPPILELTSSFAYDRIKSLTKTIQLGDGLVGMCALEKNTIWLNNVPDGYMEIESGLGEAHPTNIIIIPVKTEDNLLGVIEIASFNKFNKNEVRFIENIAEDIASTLETTKITDRTSDLLEESQKKSDELAVRDSEMSEKIDELREAQKETIRSETEMTGLIHAVDQVLFKIELSTTGRIISANNLFLKIFDFRIKELKNRNFFELIEDNIQASEEILNKLKNNESVQTTITLSSKQNKKIKILSLFSAIKNETDQIVRILFLGDNISYREELEKKNETLLTELQYKSKLISEKEKELVKNINELSQLSGNKSGDLKKFIARENTIKQNFETDIDKKYFKWIEDIRK